MCWYAAINGGVEQCFLDFILRNAVGEGGAEMQAEFIGAVESDEHCYGEKASRFPCQARASPYFAPGVARDQILKIFVEFVAILQGAIHVGIPEDGAPHRQTFLIAFTLVHRSSSSPGNKSGHFR